MSTIGCAPADLEALLYDWHNAHRLIEPKLTAGIGQIKRIHQRARWWLALALEEFPPELAISWEIHSAKLYSASRTALSKVQAEMSRDSQHGVRSRETT